MKKSIPIKYWDESKKRFNSHSFFETVEHHHISDYSGPVSCDIMIVGCKDGRWYIEDNWGEDTKGVKDVFNPFDKSSFPTFFPCCESANKRAAEIVASITGCNPEELMLEDEQVQGKTGDG